MVNPRVNLNTRHGLGHEELPLLSDVLLEQSHRAQLSPWPAAQIAADVTDWVNTERSFRIAMAHKYCNASGVMYLQSRKLGT